MQVARFEQVEGAHSLQMAKTRETRPVPAISITVIWLLNKYNL